MKYNTKKEAEAAAREFAIKKFEDGFFVGRREFGNRIVAYYAESRDKTFDMRWFDFPPLPEIAKDTPAWVSNYDGHGWEPAYATGNFTDDGWIEVYDLGRTSFTAPIHGGTCHMEYYSLTDPKK